MFLLLWQILTKKTIQVDGKSWPWPRSHLARKLHKRFFRLPERLVRDVEIIDRNSHFRFKCTTFAEFKRCATMFIKEPGTREWIRTEARAGDVFYDVGANIGIYSILAADRVGETGKVFAFEPHAANFTRLLENIAVNKLDQIVVPCNFALHDQDGFLPFVYFSGEAGSSRSQLCSMRADFNASRETEISELKYATSVDSLIASGRFPAPHHVKIDVDGGELLILRGMDRVLSGSERPRTVQVEINKGCKEDIVAFMERHNYVLSEEHYTRHGLELIEQGGDPEDYEYNAIFRPRPESV
jgi:FkbM family methyltransferase